MSTATQQAPRGRGQGKRSRGQNQRNQTARSGDGDAMSLANRGSDEVVSTTLERVSLADNATVGDKSEEPDVCWICAEEIRFWSIGECNHITCHVCALRLRALYKRTECTFCKVSIVLCCLMLNADRLQNPQPSVIFASTPANQYQSYDVESMEFKDAKLSIYFETGEMMEDSLILLRFNCPDPDCDYIATGGWADLKWHVRDAHKRVMWSVGLYVYEAGRLTTLLQKRSLYSEQEDFHARAHCIHPETAGRSFAVSEQQSERETKGRSGSASHVRVLS